jgi:diadenosine tetraphosphatase ApaH/serine/threonine PP2A family protein phosphatase
LSTYPIWEAREAIEPVDRYGQVNWALLVITGIEALYIKTGELRSKKHPVST